MNVEPVATSPFVAQSASKPEVPSDVTDATKKDVRSAETKEAFQKFVGETFFSQMLSSMRKTVRKPAFFHGGRAEEVFQGQLDQVLSEELSEASAGSFSGPMYELFCLQPQK